MVFISDVMKEYHDYVNKSWHSESKTFDRYDIFLEVSKNYNIKKALYPGSYIHITPSLVIPEVVYVDSDKKAISFFENKEEIVKYVEKNKIYEEKSKISFESKDYNSNLSISKNYYDLLISQFAGFVSQACKKYLKSGGILLANDSHGDATLAKVDNDFEFIGVLNFREDKYYISTENLDEYFTFKRKRPIDIDKVTKTMKGPKYKNNCDYYLFRKL
jgi:hypothetical protein